MRKESSLCFKCNNKTASSKARVKPLSERKRSINSNGYIRVFVPGRGDMLEHRLIMENFIGRKLLPNETVHHKNGVKTDNRLENLELWSSTHPSGQRVSDLLSWARDIIKLYG